MLMKNLVFLYAGESSSHAFDRIFDGKSSFERTLAWASEMDDCEAITIACNTENECKIKECTAQFHQKKIQIENKDSWVTRNLLEAISKSSEKNGARTIIYASADKPFLDGELTKKLIECHKNYVAEYTYAEGFPIGFAPEIIDSGSAAILHSLSCDTQKKSGDEKISSECIFNVMKGDINSFEIEAVIAPKDYRLLRFDFSCSSKRNMTSCKKLFDIAVERKIKFTAENLSEIAEKTPEILQTLPSYYGIEISPDMNSIPYYNPYRNFASEAKKKNIMSLEKFNSLMSQIKQLSEDAVISLNVYGEPLLNRDFAKYAETVLHEKKFSLLIETDGILVTEELASEMKRIADENGKRENGQSSMTWIVKLDAFSETKYNELIENGNFKKAVESISILEKYFPDDVYPDFTRTCKNEDELESFYRFWHDSTSPSRGRLIVEKYNDFCKMLPNEKPADLTPLERNVCWHIRRDMMILSDGSVPLCRQCILESSIGNAFEEGIEKLHEKMISEIERHLCGNYSEKCRACDEYYTFNF